MEEDNSEQKPHEHKHHEVHKTYMEHEQHKRQKSHETYAWIFGIVAVVLAILFIASLATKGFSGTGTATAATTGKTLSAAEIQTKAEAYLNQLFAGQGQNATVDSVKDVGDLYSLNINVGGRTYNSFARKDGSFLFPSGIDLTQAPAAAPAATAQAPTVVPKSDKPQVELFVMAYCPYGTQAEKGILPAIRTLGDKVDFKVRFVYYSMHGQKEVNQNLMQYCIQTEQPDKYLNYLACFLNDSAGQGSDSAINACLASTQVDQTKLNACIAKDDAAFNVTANWNNKASWLSGNYPLFSTDAALNVKYGVQGSPTLVINGVQSNAGRDSASFLAGICNSFNNQPAECNTQLSSTTPGTGFGYDSTAAATAAGCGV